MTTSSKKNRKQKTSPALDICVVILVVIASFMLMSLFGGCKPVERITVRTEFVDRLRYDSVYLSKSDSIYTYINGDTVRIEKFKTVYKDRLKIIKDTVVRTDTLVTVSKPITKIVEKKVRGLLWWIGLINIIAVGGWLVYKLFTKKQRLWPYLKSFKKSIK